MRKNNLLKTLLIVLVIGWSGVVLMPTFQLNQQQKTAEEYYKEIEEATSLTRNDIKAALSQGNLELQVRDTFKGTNGKSVEELLEDVNALIELDEQIAENEPKSIKLGLDLQGGTYLVYEVDLPSLLESLSKQRDANFDAAIEEVKSRVNTQNEDFFDALQAVFQEKDMRLNRHFGVRGDSDDKIIQDLKDQAEDAVERTLEVLRNRIDQFGVSEPSITKQGADRIVVELAGVQDVERAKSIIGTTALLEFQMEAEPEVASAVLREINLVMKKQMAKDQGEDVETATADSYETPQKLRRDTEVSLEDVFGESSIFEETAGTDSSDAGSTVLLHQEIFQDRPFDALLANLGGDIGVPTKNVRTVERILNSPGVREIMPNDAEFLFLNKPTRIGEQEYYRLYMVKKEPEMTGRMIANANVQIGSQLRAGEAMVGMELTSEGAKIFSKVTGANIGKRMAIVLDGKIVSIPNIQERIPSGNAQITGMANMDEAKDLAIVLRAGALPAPIQVIQERTVGPSLGQDSIQKGTSSALAGLAVVVIFMVVYYRLSGLVADVALLLNIFIIMAVLAGFHATLTLPGVAGIILTIGMAVDANVLIFERIREELRHGKTVRAAIDNGYARAFKTIIDANVTTLLTALVLYQFGTGPIRGFALTLSIGILASMFTAIVVTRVIFDYFTNKMTMQKLSI
ncbi:protein translocase subunit SecD [candidate division KSB1 bacterium]|nr:protein translocase subunit SecD [candidate division KSB1 bacterium]